MIYYIDINKVVAFSKFSFRQKDFKDFIGYKGVKKVRPLWIIFPKMIAYRRDFDETEYFFFDKKWIIAKSIIKSWIKLRITSKKDFAVSFCMMKNI